ncbi:MAG: hypothetical protein JWQ27_2406 [Ferruginibacter sp.]|nr:hypothetical protein [Ferruginibacter sp.]
MYNLEETIIKFNDIVAGEMEENQFFHRNSIYNFLIHFDEIRNDQDKNQALRLINEYLDYSVTEECTSKGDCEKAFFEFILPVGIIFKGDASFNMIFGYRGIILLLVLVNVVLFAFRINIWCIAAVNLAGLPIILYLFKKSKSTRVYGINW